MKQIRKIIRRNYVNRNEVITNDIDIKSTDNITTDVNHTNVKNKKNKMDTKMVNVTSEQLNLLEGALDMSNTKIVKKDRGLIERTESSKIILTEDNRQVLTD